MSSAEGQSSKPWKRSAPKDAKHTKLTEASKKKAQARANEAGRKYPNLVDNMWAAQQQREDEEDNKGKGADES